MDASPRLISSARDGDLDSLGQLLEFVRPRVVTWCAARLPPVLRSQYDAEDVAQDVLLSANGAIADLRGDSPGELNAWLFRISENRIRDLLDHASALKRQLPRPVTFSQTSPSGAARRGERATRVHLAIASLSEDHRDVIRLRKIEERSVKEVAEIMGRSEAAIRVLYFRALAALKDAIGNEP